LHEGFLNINKPAGITSHDVVSKVRRILKTKAVGHMGTLDPQATGVLPLAVGRATRLIQYVEGDTKAYLGELILGLSTTTQDIHGQTVCEQDATNVTEATLQSILPEFIGVISQVPPMYSAIKVQGKKLYEYARQGIEIELEARQVEINSLQLLSFRYEGMRVVATLEIKCSKGTYIRSLFRDIGSKLSLPACMGQLTRTASGPFCINQSVTLDNLATNPESHIVPIAELMTSFEKIQLSQTESLRFLRGQRLGGRSEFDDVYAVFWDNVFLGVAEVEQSVLSPKKVLAQEGDIKCQ